MVISYSYILELRQELYTPVDPEARPEIEPASVMPSLLSSGGLGLRSNPLIDRPSMIISTGLHFIAL